jgi:hypothetical protein
VFRGVAQSVAGVSLSTVVRRTHIPLSKLPSSEVGSIKSTIGPEASLRQALRIITQFRHDYKCAAVQADIVKWVANKPKPKPKPKRSAKHHGKTKSGQSKTSKSKSKTPARHTTTKHAAPAKHPTPVRTTGTSKAPTSTRTTRHSGTTTHSGSPTKTSTSKNAKHPASKSGAHKRTRPTKKRTASRPHSVPHVKYPPEPVMPAFCPAFTGASG